MVNSSQAREDVDTILTKTITYHSYSTKIADLAYATQKRGTPQCFSIYAQVTVQKMDSKYVEDGILKSGDLIGLFRYEYTTQTDGTAICPALIPKKGDEIIFLDRYFVIKECTPATSEDDGIIGWDFTAGQTN